LRVSPGDTLVAEEAFIDAEENARVSGGSQEETTPAVQISNNSDQNAGSICGGDKRNEAGSDAVHSGKLVPAAKNQQELAGQQPARNSATHQPALLTRSTKFPAPQPPAPGGEPTSGTMKTVDSQPVVERRDKITPPASNNAGVAPGTAVLSRRTSTLVSHDHVRGNIIKEIISSEKDFLKNLCDIKQVREGIEVI
jgi:hypothetical protein